MKKNKNKYSKPRSSFSFTTVISLTMVLFLLGLLGLMAILAKSLSDYAKESISFSVILKDQTSESQTKKIQKYLDASEFVKSTKYITKEQAMKELEESLGEDLGYLDANPLLASIEVKLNSRYANEETINSVMQNFKKYDQIKEVIYQKDLLHAINQNLTTIGLFLAGIVGLLLIISIGLINNTIRLGVHSQRFLIRTMQLVGASSSFIRYPFIKKNVEMGIVASLLAISGVSALLYVTKDMISPILNVDSLDKVIVVFASILILGIVVTLLSSSIAVNRYLYMKQRQLHK